MDRTLIADHIVKVLTVKREALTAQYLAHKDSIAFFIVDDLLPTEIADARFMPFRISEW